MSAEQNGTIAIKKAMNTRINNIHDKFVKELLANREVAIAFLSEFLPSEIVILFDFDTLIYEPTSYLNT
ncbi:MAG: Rpn family recombination-promoting nuclease/putative transposase, partial [Spirosomataceae bacterium]